MPSPSSRQRLRDVCPNLKLGNYSPGPLNGITDVAGVFTHTITLQPSPSINTGATILLPHANWLHEALYAGMFRFNGAGEMTGAHWLQESGLLHTPIVLTGSWSVGDALRGVCEAALAQEADGDFGVLPVVAETLDSYLTDIRAFAVTPKHIVEGIEKASGGLTPEGCTGGGTGMICHGLKGGTGTASRVVTPRGDNGSHQSQSYTIGALVQANYGALRDLRIAGVPVGRLVQEHRAKDNDPETLRHAAAVEASKEEKDGSIIVVLATDAPLHPTQLTRLAKRATVGLARVGGYGHSMSGDLFVAFSTANKVPAWPMSVETSTVELAGERCMNGLLEAAADATEEAIYNALCMATTTVGKEGRKVDALDLDFLKEVMEKYAV